MGRKRLGAGTSEHRRAARRRSRSPSDLCICFLCTLRRNKPSLDCSLQGGQSVSNLHLRSGRLDHGIAASDLHRRPPIPKHAAAPHNHRKTNDISGSQLLLDLSLHLDSLGNCNQMSLRHMLGKTQNLRVGENALPANQDLDNHVNPDFAASNTVAERRREPAETTSVQLRLGAHKTL